MKVDSEYLEDAPVTAIASPAASTRILLSISEPERRLFLPGFSNQIFADTDWHRYDNAVRDPVLWRATLEETRPEILMSCWSTPALPVDWLSAPRCPLRYVAHITGSIRKVVPRSFLEQGGLVTNWGSTAAPMVAEHALLLGLAALRNLPAWKGYFHLPPKGRRCEQLETRSLFGRHVGIHGFGEVARALVRLLKPFHPAITAYSDGVPPDFIESHGAMPCDNLETLFSKNEVLFECEALTKKSEKSVGLSLLSRLPDGAVFVNVGRGLLVDEKALIHEAASGRLRVALDVAAHEPLSSDSELYKIPQILLSPHIGGPTVDHYPDCADLALANVRRYLTGEPLQAQVTLEMFDRST